MLVKVLFTIKMVSAIGTVIYVVVHGAHNNFCYKLGRGLMSMGDIYG